MPDDKLAIRTNKGKYICGTCESENDTNNNEDEFLASGEFFE